MTKILLSLLTLPLWSAHAQIHYQHDFESAVPKTGERIKTMSVTDAKIVPVSSTKETAAAKPEGKNSALMIQGGVEEPHQWQPAGDITLPDLKENYLYIGFMLKNASFDASLFGIQVSNNQPAEGKYGVYQRMRMYPTHISLSGTGRGLGKEQLSSGNDAKWMNVEWIIPTPGAAGTPRLLMNGVDQGELRLEPVTEDVPSLNLIRIWLPGRKGEDTKFLIDDVLIASAPTLEKLGALVRKGPRSALP